MFNGSLKTKLKKNREKIEKKQRQRKGKKGKGEKRGTPLNSLFEISLLKKSLLKNFCLIVRLL